MERYYFTFGSWERFPYKNTYLVVIAYDHSDAIKSFREKHPDIYEGTLNCSDYYSEKLWNKHCKKHYEGKNPAEVIWSKNFGDVPEGFDDVFIYVQSMRQIVRIAEGTGDNLLPEDTENGYVDYIYYEQHSLDVDMSEVDGGQILTYQLVRDKYKRLTDCIPEVLDIAYGEELDFKIL